MHQSVKHTAPGTVCVWDAFGEYTCKRTPAAQPQDPFFGGVERYMDAPKPIQAIAKALGGKGKTAEPFFVYTSDGELKPKSAVKEGFCGCGADVAPVL